MIESPIVGKVYRGGSKKYPQAFEVEQNAIIFMGCGGGQMVSVLDSDDLSSYTAQVFIFL